MTPGASAAPSLVARGRAWVHGQFIEPERPLVAIEVRASSVGVLRVRREKGGLVFAAAAVLDLPPETLTLSLAQPNVVNVARFDQRIQKKLGG